MAAIEFDEVEETTRTRDGRQWLKDVDFCESITKALNVSFNESKYLKATIVGKPELRKLRGALRHFAAENEWGLSLKTVGDESEAAADDVSYAVTFRAQPKREAPESTGPRKVRRRKDETDEDYVARVRDEYPRDTKNREKPADYDARIAALTGMAA